MKTLYLIRHAKSDWSIDHLSDIDRPLNERGYGDAHKMSLILKEKKIVPDLIISSPAVRAISTALIFCRALNYDPKSILINKNLYDTSVKEYTHAISKIDNKHQIVFLFGHNPTITNTANTLTNSLTEEMPTCCIAGIQSDINNWEIFSNTNNALIYFDFPKKHLK
ncbi:MAG TPA: histidine phosphatase family protein [Bacteroidia bacterium]|nr:histidine phosphatase family protein [Bacteroidia bacterium]